MKRLFLFAGEKSGDLHGSHLMQALPADTDFWGVGGTLMREKGLRTMMEMEQFEVIGLAGILKELPGIVQRFRKIRDAIIQDSPDGVILIDYPGFNLRLANALRKKGYQGKIIQYVSPTFWAWGASRVQQMESTLDLLLCIYPFEKEKLAQSSLNVAYVGNPVRESVANYSYNPLWKEEVGIEPGPLVALFPGSRKREIADHLPIQLEAAERFRKKHPKVVFGVSSIDETLFSSYNLPSHFVPVPKQFSYELMRDANVAIAKSGTVTLELALHETPTVVMYHVSWINYLYARFLLKLNLPYYCIVNILKDKEVFPEYIAEGLTPKNVADRLEDLYQNPKECIEECRSLIPLLEECDTSKRAAEAILKLFD